MKKLLLCLAVIGLASFVPVTSGLTEAERNTATKFLTNTENGVLESINGLSETQLSFKPAPDINCLENKGSCCFSGYLCRERGR